MPRWLKDRLAQLGQAIGRARAVGAARDEACRAQAGLHESESRYRIVSELTSDYAYALAVGPGGELSCEWISGAFTRVTGFTVDETVADGAWGQFVHPDDRALVAGWRQSLLAGQSDTSEFRIVTKGGDVRVVCDYVRPVWDDDQGRVVRIFGAAQDITERKRAEEQLVHDALHDGLTGLPNRALFIDRLAQALARTGRDQSTLAVLFLDLDRFKLVNDSFGHEIGDQLLVAIGRRLEAVLRPGDTLARLGGDEFTVLLAEVRDVSYATRVADRIHQRLAEPFRLGRHEVHTTASIGIALGTSNREQPESLLRDADTAMFRAKALGRACHQVFDAAMHTRVLELLRLESDLRHAVARGELRLHYQPIVSLATDRVIGIEALLRWQHPERGLIVPAEFIPLAEETGLITSIGEWVFNAACAQAMVWKGRDLPFGSVSINLSAAQFKHRDLASVIRQALRNSGLEPVQMELDLTEDMIMDNPEVTVAVLGELKRIGVRLTIDDFGSGYSSLSHLNRFPIDTLKIAMSLVHQVGQHPAGGAMVTAVIGLARSLNMDVIAEGVETGEQLAFLRSRVCGGIQGYVFSAPVQADALTTLLERGQRL
jgi:diguanylate cyclase (GGDEF)-like protein/PAS domain S-box-containing protein